MATLPEAMTERDTRVETAVAGLANELLQAQSPEIARALAEAMTRTGDGEVRRGVRAALRSLADLRSIDQVCLVWLKTRHQELGRLLEEAGWVASGPERLTLLTTLKAGRRAQLEQAGAELVEPLLQATQDEDPVIAAEARLALQGLQNPAAQAELYRLVIEVDHRLAREVGAIVPYAPRDPQQRALFYLLTEQWDRYDLLDFDHSLIRAAYQVSDEWLQGRMADLTRRAGRIDFIEVIAGGRQRRRLADMNDGEWSVVLALLARHESWPEMWRLAQAAPAMWSANLLQRLGEAGWQPPLPADAAGLAELVQLAARCTAEGLQLAGAVRCQAALTGHTGAVYDVAISPVALANGAGGQLLASASEDRTLRLWSLPAGQPLKTLAGHTDEVWGLAISADGRLLVSGSEDDTVRLWRLPDGQPLQVLTGTMEALNALAISPAPLGGGQGEWLLASGSRDHTVRLWSLPAGKALKKLAGHTDLVIKLAASPDGRWLASASRDGTVRLWRLPEGTAGPVLRGHTGAVNCLAFNASGRLLASGSLDKTVRLWSLPEGKPVQTLTGHTDTVVGLAMTPASSDGGLGGRTGGNVVASASLDRTIRLWRLPEGTPVQTLTGHSDWVMSLAMSADGQWLASASLDNTVRLWASDLARLSRLPIARLTPEDIAWARERLERGKLAESERNWLKFLLALQRWQRRFDIEVEEAPHHVVIGEYDIELEG